MTVKSIYLAVGAFTLLAVTYTFFSKMQMLEQTKHIDIDSTPVAAFEVKMFFEQPSGG